MSEADSSATALRAVARDSPPTRPEGTRRLRGRAVVEQQLLDPPVTVLPRGVDRAKAAALRKVRIRAVLERELHELVARLFVLSFRCSRRVDDSRLDVLVS